MNRIKSPFLSRKCAITTFLLRKFIDSFQGFPRFIDSPTSYATLLTTEADSLTTYGMRKHSAVTIITTLPELSQSC